MLATFADIEREVTKCVAFVHRETEKLNRGSAIADKADRDLVSYLSFVNHWKGAQDLLLTPGWKAQAGILVASTAWGTTNIIVDVMTGQTIAEHLFTGLKMAVDNI